MNELLDAALAYAAEGRAVLPLHTAINGTCSCGRTDCSSPAKHPRVRHGLHAATTDMDQIRAWWARWPEANIGIRTGEASNLVVLDIDIRHGGHHALADLAEQDPAVLDTRLIRTGGGWHLYFIHPGDAVRNSTGVLGSGIDVRGDGGYIVAPPSTHVSGRDYNIADGRLIAPLPLSIIESTSRTFPGIASFNSSMPLRSGSKWARAAFEREIALVATAEPGTRNTTLVRAAFKLGQLVGTGLLDQYSTSGALVLAATHAGLPLHEAAATVTRGVTAGASQPRSQLADRADRRAIGR